MQPRGVRSECNKRKYNRQDVIISFRSWIESLTIKKCIYSVNVYQLNRKHVMR